MIKEKLSLVPHTPGCYLMKDKNGYIIYVGKSKNLKNRLTSYFHQTHSGKTKVLVENIYDFEYILTSSELEALLLEINLIKKYNPKYNILLRDDKTYPYIELTNEKVPRLLIVRNPHIKKNKNRKLFGPYPNVTAARKTVEIINRLYPLRKCKTYSKKECLYYHLNECLGYCTHSVDEKEIITMKNEIISFLNGNHSIITNKLKEKMYLCSENMNYEKAQEYKELLDYISITLEKQKVELDDNYNRDIINYYTDNNYMSISHLFIRGGKLLDRKNIIFPLIDSPEESLSSYITTFYQKHTIYPKEVLVPSNQDTNLLEQALDVKFIIPQKGRKKNILELAYENAKNYFDEQITIIKKDDDKALAGMEELSQLLHLPKLSKIELFDNSNLFGTFNVSGMVVFIDGKPSKNDYRKYKITSDMADDYNTMKEVIYRRYFRLLKDNEPFPDLIIVDGGVGQINVAREVITSLGLSIPVAGLKKDDKHSTSSLLGNYPLEEIPIKKTSELFLLLTRMQDEVHNYTISYHRSIRSTSSLASILDNIDGVGEVRKNKLLKKYKTITKMKEASKEELKEILPSDIVDNFIESLKKI